MSPSDDTPNTTSRQVVLATFCVLQFVAYVAALTATATAHGPSNPWPTIVTFGMVLAQSALAASVAVFGPWRVSIRMMVSAGLAIVGADAFLFMDGPHRIEDLFLLSLFASLMWGVQQVTLWFCRLLLQVRTITNNATVDKPARAQYGIRQLMGLTLAISVLLGSADTAATGNHGGP